MKKQIQSLNTSRSTGTSSLNQPKNQASGFGGAYRIGQNTQQSIPNYPTIPLSSSISNSYQKMGFGRIGDLGGRMGELEKASLRLGETAATRRLKEQEAESQSQQLIAKQKFGYESRLQSQREKNEENLALMRGLYT